MLGACWLMVQQHMVYILPSLLYLTPYSRFCLSAHQDSRCTQACLLSPALHVNIVLSLLLTSSLDLCLFSQPLHSTFLLDPSLSWVLSLYSGLRTWHSLLYAHCLPAASHWISFSLHTTAYTSVSSPPTVDLQHSLLCLYILPARLCVVPVFLGLWHLALVLCIPCLDMLCYGSSNSPVASAILLPPSAFSPVLLFSSCSCHYILCLPNRS